MTYPQQPGRPQRQQQYAPHPDPQQSHPQHPQYGYDPTHQSPRYSTPRRDDARYDEPRYEEQRRWEARRPATPPPAPRRKVWPWVLLGVLMVPILGFVACTAVFAGGVAVVEQQRAGGTVAIGESFTYASGLGISVATPTSYEVDNEFLVPAGEEAYEAVVTITNGTDQAVGAVLITMNATVNNRPAQQVFDGEFLPTQDIAPGQQLVVPFRFSVPEGATGPLQIAVTDTFNEPVFFTGQLG